MDLELVETGNGGDIIKNETDLSVINGFQNMAYLAMFGGNPGSVTPVNRPDNAQAFDWFANNVLFRESRDIQFNSLTENTLMNVELNSSGASKIQQAVQKDLEFMKEFAEVEISVSIISDDQVEISVLINEPDNQQNKPFIFLWDSTEKELPSSIQRPRPVALSAPTITGTLMTECDLDLVAIDPNVPAATGFEWQRSLLPSSGFVTIETTSLPHTSDGNLPVNTYYYRARSLGGIPSPWSNVATVIVTGSLPVSPEITQTITPLSTEDVLYEVAFSTFDSDWIAEISDDNGATWTPSPTIPTGTNQYLFSGLTQGSPYLFRVKKDEWDCFSPHVSASTYYNLDVALSADGTTGTELDLLGTNGTPFEEHFAISFWFICPQTKTTASYIYNDAHNGNTAQTSIVTSRFGSSPVQSSVTIYINSKLTGQLYGIGHSFDADDQWHHIIIENRPTGNGSEATITMSFDGVTIGSTTRTPVYNATHSPTGLMGGGTVGGTRSFEGALDQFVYLENQNVIEDVETIYNNGRGADLYELYDSSKFYRYFDFNEGIPNGDNTLLTQVVDRSPNNQPGNLDTGWNKIGTTSNWVPSKPLGGFENLILTALSATEIQIDITYPYGDVSMAIERSLDGITGWAAIAASPVAGGTASVTDPGLTTVTEYFYRSQGDGMTGYFKIVSATTL